MGRALDFMDMGEKNIYKVDVLQGIRWRTQAWGEMASDVIRTCWRHTKVLNEDVDMNVDSMIWRDLQELDKEIGQVVQESNERMRVDNLLKHESEMDSAEPVSERDLVAFITGCEE